MVGRRIGSLAFWMVFVGFVTSCGRMSTDSGAGAESVVPDTVDLPGATPQYVAPLAVPVVAQHLVAAAAPEQPGVDPTVESMVESVVESTVAGTVEQSVVGAHDVFPLAAGAGGFVEVGRADGGLRQATFQFSGDTLVHSPLVRRAGVNANGNGYDFAPMYSRVAPILSTADLAVCHLESPVAPTGKALSTYPQYGIPPEIALALASAGYDRCSTASNHTIDRGTGSIDATVGALEAAGLSQAGMARTPEESTASLVDVNGITVAHLSYTYGFNGARLPAGEPWRSNLIDVPTIIAAAIDARARGAEIVIVNMHWGTEAQAEITTAQRQIADALTASGEIDLIVGEHAHVIQPIEQINGRWVVFGMGNFLSNMPTGPFPPSSQDGMIVSVSFSEQADGSFAVAQPVVIPTWVDRNNGWIIRPVLGDLADPSVGPGTKTLLEQSLQRTRAVVGGFVPA